MAKPDGTLVIADEIQKVPELLDAVYWLMVNRGLHFILSGSSARKLKKSGANTLGGRANPRTLFPLVWKEVTDFQIDKAVQNTMTKKQLQNINDLKAQGKSVREIASLLGLSKSKEFRDQKCI